MKLYHLPWKARHSPHSKLLDWHRHLVKPHLGQSSPSILDWRKRWKANTRNHKEVAKSTEQADQRQESDYSPAHTGCIFWNPKRKWPGKQCPAVTLWLWGKQLANEKRLQLVPFLPWIAVACSYFGWAAAAATLSCSTSICTWPLLSREMAFKMHESLNQTSNNFY